MIILGNQPHIPIYTYRSPNFIDKSSSDGKIFRHDHVRHSLALWNIYNHEPGQGCQSRTTKK